MSPPQTVAHYRIVSKLGEGGMGAVYRATDTKLHRDLWADKQLRGSGPAYFDIAPDGKHFAVLPRSEAEEKQGNIHVTFLLNFLDEVVRKVSVGK